MDQQQTNPPGNAEVHTRMEVEPGGEADTGFEPAPRAAEPPGSRMDEARQKAGEVADEAKSRVEGAAAQARDRVDQARDRARGAAEQAKARAGEIAGRASEYGKRAAGEIEQRTGAISALKDNPLPALGVAFGVGFLLAGSSDSSGRFGKAKSQIKGAVMGGVSAAVSQQARELLDSYGGASGLMEEFLGRNA